MNKTTIELARVDHIVGYGFIHGWPMTSDRDVLEALLNWSQSSDGQGRTVYRHIVRSTEEHVNCSRWHYAHERGKSQEECAKLFEGVKEDALEDNCASVHRMPMCDAVTYLDIYWQ